MLPAASIRSVQIELRFLPLQPDYIRQTFERLGQLGYNTVYLQYEDTFPFRRHRTLRGSFTYSRAQVRQINQWAKDNGLQIIPLTYSFSHSDQLLQRPQYADLAESDAKASLCLTHPRSIDLMAELAEDVLELHPESKFIHIGGDEIQQLIACPRCTTAMCQHGRSGVLVNFLNKVARRFRQLGVRPAIWSDMLIRYPQAIDNLSRDLLIFYWDYWSHGERQPFLTIGGGFSDMFILDKKAITGDLAVMTHFPLTRPLEELPQGLATVYRDYWKLDRKQTSAKSFPYLQFFTDHRFDVIGSALPYVELGSILPNVQEKWSHLTHAVKRIHETGAAGGTLCHWAPFWPPLETLWLGITAFSEGLQHNHRAMAPEKILPRYTTLTLGQDAPDFANAVWNASRRFELGDIFNPTWQIVPPEKKIQWHRDAGMVAREHATVNKLSARLPGHQKCFRKYAVKQAHARLFEVLSQEMKLKLKYEKRLLKELPIQTSLRKKMRALRPELQKVWSVYYVPSAVKKLTELRLDPYC
ncbi:MAG: hypothetical protein B9S32_09860 [Verrucomicrobia bacterium Tous-C9LFEB]|nr:MAG: hypothetical protein B9S32_09860 [Verrucomicrobia bacterium Tous-C9LFEB]